MEKEMAQLAEANHRLRSALEEIKKGEGTYSRDPLTHARNTIDNAIRIATEALRPNGPSSGALLGIIVQAGTDSESGRPSLTIETTEQQLRDLSISPYGKQCRVAVSCGDLLSINFMTNEEYKATQDLLLQAGRMVDMLDLNGFRDRIRHAGSIGSVLDPTLYLNARRNLEAIDRLASDAIRLKGSFQTLKSQVALELEAVRDDA